MKPSQQISYPSFSKQTKVFFHPLLGEQRNDNFDNDSICGKKVVILGSGSGTNFANLVSFLRKFDVEISGLFCDKQGAKILDRARDKEVITFDLQTEERQSKRKLNDALLRFLGQVPDLDLVLLAGYMRILPPRVVHPYRSRILNIHPSLLPRFPGLHAMKRSFEDSSKEVGVTVHLVSEGVDEGPILGQATIRKKEGWSFLDFQKRLHLEEYALYPRVVLRYLSLSKKEQETLWSEWTLERR